MSEISHTLQVLATAYAEAKGDAGLLVGTFGMDAGQRFDRHWHDVHQLAWASAGALRVFTAEGTWFLPPTRALWIPAGAPHITAAAVPTTMTGAYLRPERCPITWTEPTVVAVDQLLADLIRHLSYENDLAPDARQRAEAVVYDLLRPAPGAAVSVRWPTDERAREVAEALAENPADGRTLAAWGTVVGASDRTLARAFVRDTGLGFSRWRTQLRLHAALGRLAAGDSVATVARRVGYGTTSSFVATFRQAFGTTPGAYFTR